MARALDHCLHVDHRGDIAAAMADKHADARRLVGNVAFRRINFGFDASAARRREQVHCLGSGRAGLHHGVGNVLGFLENAARKDPGA